MTGPIHLSHHIHAMRNSKCMVGRRHHPRRRLSRHLRHTSQEARSAKTGIIMKRIGNMIEDDIMIDTEIAILTTKRGHGTVNTYQTLGEEVSMTTMGSGDLICPPECICLNRSTNGQTRGRCTTRVGPLMIFLSMKEGHMMVLG